MWCRNAEFIFLSPPLGFLYKINADLVHEFSYEFTIIILISLAFASLEKR